MKFHNLKKRTTKTIGTVIFNGTKVLKYLNKIKETKSPGYDSLHPKVIKETASQNFETFNSPFLSVSEKLHCTKKMEIGKCYAYSQIRIQTTGIQLQTNKSNFNNRENNGNRNKRYNHETYGIK